MCKNQHRVQHGLGTPRLVGNPQTCRVVLCWLGPPHCPSKGAGPAWKWWPHWSRSSIYGVKDGIRSGSSPTGPWLSKAGDWHPVVSLGNYVQPRAELKWSPQACGPDGERLWECCWGPWRSVSILRVQTGWGRWWVHLHILGDLPGDTRCYKHTLALTLSTVCLRNCRYSFWDANRPYSKYQPVVWFICSFWGAKNFTVNTVMVGTSVFASYFVWQMLLINPFAASLLEKSVFTVTIPNSL